MAAGRRIPVTVEADTDGNFDVAARGLEDLARDADNADASVRRYSKGHQSLQSEIGKTERGIAALRAEFAKTGNLNLLGDVDKQERTLTRLRRQMVDLGGDTERIGAQGGLNFSEGFMGVISSLPVQVKIGLAAGLAAVLPGALAFVGAAVGGAILAGIGGAGLGAGIALQVQDARVKAAFTDLGGYIKRTLTNATAGLADPLVSGLSTFKREAQPFFDSFAQGIQKLAPQLALLGTKLGESLAKLGPGLAKALDAAGPVLGALANSLPILFNGFKIFFEQVSAGGKGAAEGIYTLVRAIAGIVAGTGYAIRGLSNMFDAIVTGMDKVTGILAKIPGFSALFGPLHDYVHSVATSFDAAKVSGNDFGGSLDRVQVSADGTTTALGTTSAAANYLQGVFDQLNGKTIGTLQAQIGARQALDSLTQSLKDNGKELDVNTTKGAANTQAAIAVAQAAAQVAQKKYEETGSLQQARAAYDGYIGKLRETLTAAGVAKPAIDALVASIGQMPPQRSTEIKLPGAAQSKADLAEIRRGLDLVDGRVANATVTTTFYTQHIDLPGIGAPGSVYGTRAKGGMRKAAVGMIIPPRNPGTVLAGEPQTGGELLIPLKGLDKGRARNLLNVGAQAYGMDVGSRGSGYANPVSAGRSSGGGGPIALTVVVRDDTGRMLQVLRKEISGQGGDVQTVLGSNNG